MEIEHFRENLQDFRLPTQEMISIFTYLSCLLVVKILNKQRMAESYQELDIKLHFIVPARVIFETLTHQMYPLANLIQALSFF